MIKGKFNLKELEKYQKQLEKMATESEQISQFCKECSKEIAARLLSSVIPRTPVGQNLSYIDSDGKKKVMKTGGTLRRGWIAKSEEEAEKGSKTNINAQEIVAFVNSLDISKNGKIYTIEVINPVHYSSYVENGHRQEVGRYVPAIGKKLTKSWVDGKFMLKISEEEIDNKIDGILEKKIQKFLEECFDGK